MNDAQRIALERHCRLPQETMYNCFSRKHGTYTELLTVNSGFE